MTESKNILDHLIEEHDRLGRAIAKKQRELRDFSQSCRGPLDSPDKAELCTCQLELQTEFNRLGKLRVRYADAIAYVRDEGAVCEECGVDISARLMRVPTTLCCEHATVVEVREDLKRRTLRWQPAMA